MERKASILSLMGTDAKDSALMVKIFTLILGLSLLAVAAVAVFVLGSSVEPGVSLAPVAGVQVSSAQWNAMAETVGKDLGFILDEANPRWSILAEHFGGRSSVPRAVHSASRNPRDERFSTGVEYGRSGSTSASFGPVLRRGVGRLTAAVVPANERGERFSTRVEYGRSGSTSASFGPVLRRGVGGLTAAVVPANERGEEPGRDY